MLRFIIAILGILIAVFFTVIPPIVKWTPIEVVRTENRAFQAGHPLTEIQSQALECALEKADHHYLSIIHQQVSRNLILSFCLLVISIALLISGLKERRPNQPLQGTPAKAPSSSTEPEGRRS